MGKSPLSEKENCPFSQLLGLHGRRYYHNKDAKLEKLFSLIANGVNPVEGRIRAIPHPTSSHLDLAGVGHGYRKHYGQDGSPSLDHCSDPCAAIGPSLRPYIGWRTHRDCLRQRWKDPSFGSVCQRLDDRCTRGHCHECS